MPRKPTKKEQAESATQAFLRRYNCQHCQINGEDGAKEVFIFRGQVTFYCPTHDSCQHYWGIAGHYWRRNGEQHQN